MNAQGPRVYSSTALHTVRPQEQGGSFHGVNGRKACFRQTRRASGDQMHSGLRKHRQKSRLADKTEVGKHTQCVSVSQPESGPGRAVVQRLPADSGRGSFSPPGRPLQGLAALRVRTHKRGACLSGVAPCPLSRGLLLPTWASRSEQLPSFFRRAGWGASDTSGWSSPSRAPAPCGR